MNLNSALFFASFQYRWYSIHILFILYPYLSYTLEAKDEYIIYTLLINYPYIILVFLMHFYAATAIVYEVNIFDLGYFLWSWCYRPLVIFYPTSFWSYNGFSLISSYSYLLYFLRTVWIIEAKIYRIYIYQAESKSIIE